MTTVLFVFFVSLALSLALTPVATGIGKRLNILDQPDARKVHQQPIPRTGGLAIFFSFVLCLTLAKVYGTAVSDKLVLDRQTLFFFMGAAICFGIGFFDDVLTPRALIGNGADGSPLPFVQYAGRSRRRESLVGVVLRGLRRHLQPRRDR